MTEVPLSERSRLPPRPSYFAAARSHSRTSSQNSYTARQSQSHSKSQDEADGASTILDMPVLDTRRQEKDILQRLWDGDLETGDRLLDAMSGVANEDGLESVDVYKHAVTALPMTSRPGNLWHHKDHTMLKHTEIAPTEEVQAKPYSLEPPKSAPRYKDNVSFDFFPWVGNQPEDVLNESSVKSGHYDKSANSQTESASARLPIWSSVKHKSGLQILSSLFISSMDLRQVQSSIHSKSTFKPPPRVTLTDAKRETWLKDLADSNIPLRRLSRTIPHGIRGRVLLDHCLAKNIPTWRAVWLAKCVGANEIRAFKRKGASNAFSSGGEAKWIREWTSNVQQFIESLISSCAADGWRSRLTYGLHLVAHIYSDRLLDREVFIEWVTDALRGTTKDELPVWLLLTRLFWPGIRMYRRRGSSLAIALIEQLSKLPALCNDTTSPEYGLRLDIASLLRSLIISHPASLVMPLHWSRYHKLLVASVSARDSPGIICLKKIAWRNQRVARTDTTAAIDESQPRQRLSALLNSMVTSSDVCVLADACYKLDIDHYTLVSFVFHWSAAKSRHNSWRIYAAAGLLQRWARAGMDLNGPITSILGTTEAVLQFEPQRIYQLISELVRARMFSMGKYLQWLLAMGVTTNTRGSSGHDLRIDLLDNVPLTCLPIEVINLRRLVLTKMSRTSKVAGEVLFAKAVISQRLPYLPSTPPKIWSQHLATHAICQSSKHELALWIKGELAKTIEWAPITCTASIQHALSLQSFRATVSTLELLRDAPILSDILQIFLVHGEITVLVVAVDYINCHYDVLHAIGTTRCLFEHALGRLVDVTQRTITERPFLTTLLELATRLPKCIRTASRLRLEVIACEAQGTVAAYSPVSEHMLEALHGEDSTFSEEIEVLLGSGTSMDSPLFEKVFIDITKRTQLVLNENQGPVGPMADLLARLRRFGQDHFDTLMSEWLNYMFRAQHTSLAWTLLLPLVSSGVLTLEDLISKVSILYCDDGVDLCDVIIDIFDMILRESFVQSHEALLYGTFVASVKALGKAYQAVLSLLRLMIEFSGAGHASCQRARKVIEDPSFPEFLQDMAPANFAHNQAFEQIVSAMATSDAAVAVLDRSLGLSSTILGSSGGLKHILHIATDFNIELCQLRLALELKYNHGDLTVSCDDLALLLLDEMTCPTPRSPHMWFRLLSVLDRGTTVQLHTICLRKLIGMISASTYDTNHHESYDQWVETTENILSIVGVTENLMTTHDLVGLNDYVVSCLADFQASTVNVSVPASDSETVEKDTTIGMHIAFTHRCLQNYLRVLVIHQRAFQQENCSQAVLSRLTVTLCLLFMDRSRQLSATLSCLLFDVVSLITDSLHECSRLHCAQILRDNYMAEDSKLDYLLGSLALDESETLTVLVPKQGSSSTKVNADEGTKVQLLALALKTWEMVQDATPVVGENDTSLNLSLFDAKKLV